MDHFIFHVSVKKDIFITFIDDISRYGYVYLIHKKSQAINTLNLYINEVKK